MNSNKTSLKSQLIRLGLVVPLALASVGAYATADDAVTAEQAAANAALPNPADWGKEKDAETDFSGDPFAVPEGSEAGTNGDEKAAKDLEAAFTNATLKSYFAAGHEAGKDLIDFNPAGATDGVLSVQTGVASGGKIIQDGTNVADLTVSAKRIVLGSGSQFSLNGSDKLVLGAFGGYGALGFASKLHHTFDKDGKDTTTTKDEDFKASVVAKSDGFGGGLFATYQADENSPLGFSAQAKVRYTQLTHLLTTKETKNLVTTVGQAEVKNAAGAVTQSKVDEVKTDKIVKVPYGYKNGAIAADLDVGYALQLAEVAGFPIVAKGTAAVGAEYDKFEKDANDKSIKGVLLVSQKLGLSLATALLDGKLQPAVGVKLSKTAALDGYDQEFAGVTARKDTKFSKFLNAGLNYRFSDAIAFNVGGDFLLQEKAKEGEADKPDTSLGFSAFGVGLAYRF